ncbi:MAG: GIY-YIG nuclease family protein [Bacteroidota bacterium]|nr:GIY-YIG nuclease family protein [Bacteroidota bacterium]
MPKCYVYILRSLIKDFIYIGSTNKLDRRLLEHNSGLVQSTKAYRPFKIVAYIAVQTERRARELEKYFKTGSGKAILKKRIIADEVTRSET